MGTYANTDILNAVSISSLSLTPDSNQQIELSKLIALTPKNWYSDAALAFGGVYYGFILIAALEYGLFGDNINFVQLQTRISTATGGFLDLVSQDFLGSSLPRLPGEPDSSFRTRILAAVLREKATRNGMIAALNAINAPIMTMTEPWFPMDCGGYAEMDSQTGTLTSNSGFFPSYGGPGYSITAYTQNINTDEFITSPTVIPEGLTIYTSPVVFVEAPVIVDGILWIGGPESGAYTAQVPASTGYGTWGDLGLPYQSAMMVLRPINAVHGSVILGFDVGGFTPSSPPGWTNGQEDPFLIEDSLIYNLINTVKCFGTIPWTAISSVDILQRSQAYSTALILPGGG